MFINQYLHSFDDKSRITIPSKFRELLGEGVYIVQGLDRNLIILPQSAFQIIYDRLMAMSITNPDARLLRELMLGSAMSATPDGSGRILLSQNLKEYANLKDEVVFVGQGDRIEIWAAELWQKQQAKINDPETNAARFAALDLSAHS